MSYHCTFARGVRYDAAWTDDEMLGCSHTCVPELFWQSAANSPTPRLFKSRVDAVVTERMVGILAFAY